MPFSQAGVLAFEIPECELADSIIEAQEREIKEMKEIIRDLESRRD